MQTDSDRPAPPASLDDDVLAALETISEQDADELRAIGTYLEELADWQEATTAGTSDDGAAVDYPDGVPERASVSVKEIAGTTYYYYQWREGDRIESKTIAQ